MFPILMMRAGIAAVALLALPAALPATLQAQSAPHRDPALDDDAALLEQAITRLEANYGAVASDIDCDAPTLPAHQLLCASADDPNSLLWRMNRLDEMASVYAIENATKEEIDPANPPMDAGFTSRRDACTDVDCLHQLLIEHTNDSLGGESPYR